jgi:hypothetical protein
MALHGEMENEFYLVEDTSAEIAELQRERDELKQQLEPEWNCYAVNSQTGEKMLVVGEGLSEHEIKDTAHKMFTSWDSDPYPGCLIEYCSEPVGSAARAKVNDLNRKFTQALQRNAELSRQVYKLQDELKEVRSQFSTPTVLSALPQAADLLNQVKGKLKGKTKITLRDVQVILDSL